MHVLESNKIMLHSTTTLIIYAAIAFAIGFVLKYILGRTGKTDFKSKYETANTENQEGIKNLARAQKSLEKSHAERDAWKVKFEDLQKKINAGQTAGKAEIKALNEKIDQAKKETEIVYAEKERANTRFDRLKNEFESYKRKMQAEKEAIKNYKIELEQLRKLEKENSATIEKLTKQNGEMKISLEKQFQKMSEINEMTSKLRRLKAKNVKIQTDLEYWEKKHFETHHQLAALKKSMEQA